MTFKIETEEQGQTRVVRIGTQPEYGSSVISIIDPKNDKHHVTAQVVNKDAHLLTVELGGGDYLRNVEIIDNLTREYQLGTRTVRITRE